MVAYQREIIVTSVSQPQASESLFFVIRSLVECCCMFEMSLWRLWDEGKGEEKSSDTGKARA